MAAGVARLILIGLSVDVASALALAVAIQLLLQHSNADYRIGPAKYGLALNEGHRFHHLKWAGIGDVNFGLFTLVWDHLMRTDSYDPARRFDSTQLGMSARPHYPLGYLDQLIYPFPPAAAAMTERICYWRPAGVRAVADWQDDGTVDVTVRPGSAEQSHFPVVPAEHFKDLITDGTFTEIGCDAPRRSGGVRHVRQRIRLGRAGRA